MTIGIIGAGNVGATLGRRFQSSGRQVLYGLRNPQNADPALTRQGEQCADIHSTVRQSDVVLLATPWSAVPSVLESIPDFGGRPLLDATNPIVPGLHLALGHTDSGGEQVQRLAPTARVVKVFNTTGAENMANPDYHGQALFMPYCGDDEDARAVTGDLLRAIGFDGVDMGPLRNARLLEPFGLMWITMAMVRQQGRNIGFVLERR